MSGSADGCANRVPISPGRSRYRTCEVAPILTPAVGEPGRASEQKLSMGFSHIGNCLGVQEVGSQG